MRAAGVIAPEIGARSPPGDLPLHRRRPILAAMRAACPSCSAAYEVPERMLGPGPRTLRCARCGSEWSVAALPPKPVPEPPPEVHEAAAQRQTQALAIPPPAGPLERALGPARQPPFGPRRESAVPPRTRPPPAVAAWFGWLASIAILAVLVWAGYTYRGDVMRIWPPSQRLYALLDLAPAPVPPSR